MLHTLVNRRALARALVTGLFLSGLSMAGVAQAAPQYSIRDVGTLHGQYAYAYSINGSGQVTGTSDGSAFAWNATTGLQDLGTGTGYGINAEGEIAGYSDAGATVWLGSTRRPLGIPSGLARSLNSRHQVVGNFVNASNLIRGFVWTENRGITEVGSLNDGYSSANDINDRGQVVGTSTADEISGQEAFIWSEGRGMVGLTPGSSSEGWAINSRGQVTGDVRGSLGGPHAFRWDERTGLQVLHVGPFDFASVGYDINAQGDVVGSFTAGPSRTFACVFIGSTVYDLNQSIAGGTDYFLAEARSINDKGQIVVIGYRNNSAHGLVLTPVVAP